VIIAGGCYCLFETAIGTCAIAWSARGVVRVGLPERTRAETELRIRASLGGGVRTKPTPKVAAVARRIALHVAGRPQRFDAVVLDMSRAPPFHRRAYDALRAVPAGATVTYGELARAAGSPRSARAVGQAMAKNPFPIVVPCHRVVTSAGSPGGFSAFGGAKTKLLLLARERP
jgi:methylated-DNA-[protein]-cysteine S-methyltransferase